MPLNQQLLRLGQLESIRPELKFALKVKRKGYHWMKAQSLIVKGKPEKLAKNVRRKDKGIQIMIRKKESKSHSV